MRIYRCLIVDDEPIARSIIENYCGHLPYLEVAESCSNALEARLAMQQMHVDILFLDINMPLVDGVSFLKTLKSPPQVIFTTAYREFAVDAFDLAACDYLLKPFSFDRFIIAIDKAIERSGGSNSPKAETEQKEDNYFFIRADGKIYKIMHDDLLYAEASGNYTRIVTTQGTYLPAMTFSAAEAILPQAIFTRVHRSFIINRSKVAHIEGNRVVVGKTEIPIGSNYKENFFRQIGFAE